MKRLLTIFAILLMLPSSTSGTASAQAVDCSQFDVWIWAQTVFESDKSAHANLDPDGNGLACEQLPFVGFAPMTGVDSRPKNIFPVSDLKVKDLDRITVKWEGVSKSILLHETGKLVTENGSKACGATQSLDFMNWVLSWVDPEDIYVEPNYGTMADYDEHQSYLWMEIADEWYMLNDVMIRSGWATYSDEGFHHLHKDELTRAESFASSHVLGANLTCGGTNLASAETTSSEHLTQAAEVQPDRGQFAGAENYYATFLGQTGPYSEEAIAERDRAKIGNSSETRPQPNQSTESQPVFNAGIVSTGNGIVNQPVQAPAETVYEEPAEEVWEAPAEPVYQEPVVEEPVYEEPVTAECHWAYGACLPVVGDLNCTDIAAKDFYADPSDPYGLDRDGDGVACES